jgi:Helix-turn-helix domain
MKGRTEPLRAEEPSSTECPIGPDEAAAFLKMARSAALAMARAGLIPAHPVTNGKRRRWLFFLSELEVSSQKRVTKQGNENPFPRNLALLM